MLSNNIPRALYIYQNCRLNHSCRNKNFTFNQNLSSQISQILNSCLKGMVFQQNVLEQVYLIVKLTGLVMVRLASSDFWKEP